MPKSMGLKRGLKDISDLFVEAPSVTENTEQTLLEEPVMTMGVYSTGESSSKKALNRLLNHYLSQKNIFTSLLTLTDVIERVHLPLKSEFPRGNELSITWNELKEFCERPLMRNENKQAERHVILFDCKFDQTFHFPTFIPILDKFIFLIKPDVESLMDAYKMIKGTRQLNSHMQYYLMFEGPWQSDISEAVYEKFSMMLLKNFNIDLTWLGHLDCSIEAFEKNKPSRLEPLFFETFYVNSVPGKLALGDYVTSFYSSERKTAI